MNSLVPLKINPNKSSQRRITGVHRQARLFQDIKFIKTMVLTSAESLNSHWERCMEIQNELLEILFRQEGWEYLANSPKLYPDFPQFLRAWYLKENVSKFKIEHAPSIRIL